MNLVELGRLEVKNVQYSTFSIDALFGFKAYTRVRTFTFR